MSHALDLDAVRSVLNERRTEIVRRTKAVGRHLRAEDGRNDQDFSDRVAFTEMDEVLEQLDDEGRAELAQLDAALARLTEGTYGSCATCGEPIAPGRLQAIPFTVHCIDHADGG